MLSEDMASPERSLLPSRPFVGSSSPVGSRMRHQCDCWDKPENPGDSAESENLPDACPVLVEVTSARHSSRSEDLQPVVLEMGIRASKRSADSWRDGSAGIREEPKSDLLKLGFASRRLSGTNRAASAPHRSSLWEDFLHHSSIGSRVSVGGSFESLKSRMSTTNGKSLSKAQTIRWASKLNNSKSMLSTKSDRPLRSALAKKPPKTNSGESTGGTGQQQSSKEACRWSETDKRQYLINRSRGARLLDQVKNVLSCSTLLPWERP